jgi:hypothetical protein
VEDIGARRLAGLIPDRYRDRLGLASSINLCARRRPPTRTRQPGISLRAEISNLFMTCILP